MSEAPAPAFPRWLLAMLLFAPAVLVLLGPRLAPVLRDPLVDDIAVKVAGAEALAGSAPIVALDGNWRVDGERAASLADDATTAALVVSFPPGPWDELTLRVVGHPQAAWRLSTTRRFGADDNPMAQTIERRSARDPLPNERVEVVSFEAARLAMMGPARVGARLELDRVPPAGDGFALLRHVEARVAARALDPQPHVPDFVALGVLPFVLAMALWLGFGWGPVRTGMAALGAGVLGALVIRFTGQRPDEQGTVWALALSASLFVVARGVLAGGGWWKWRTRGKATEPPSAALALAAALVVVGLLALAARWEPLVAARRLPLSPDGREFLALALRGGWLYDTTFAEWPFVREPLWVWVLRAWFAVAPATEASARVLGVGVSVAAMIGVAWVGVRLFGPVVGIGAAAMLALNPSWSDEATRALRLDAGMALLAVLMLVRAQPSMQPSWPRAVAWGVVGGAALLLRLSAATLVLPVLAWEMARGRLGPREGLLAVVIATVLVAPFLYASTQGGAGGDPLLAINTHAQYYTGTPGSFADVALGGSLVDIAWRHLGGAWDRLVWGPPRVRLFLGHEWLMLPGLVGAWVLLRGPHRWIAAWVALWLVPYYAIASGTASWRLGAEVHLVIAWVWWLGIEQMGRWVVGWLRRPQEPVATSE